MGFGKKNFKKPIKAKPAEKKIDVQQDRRIKALEKRLGKAEFKFYDSASSAVTNVTNTASIFNLSNVAQGNDINNRSGDRIIPRYLECHYRIVVNGQAPQSINNCRVVMLQDMYQDGTDPTYNGTTDSAFEDPTAGVTSVLVPRYKFNLKRFKILYDVVHQLGCIQTTATQAVVTSPLGVIKRFRKNMTGTIAFDATAGADASNKEGATYCMVVSDNNTAGIVTFALYSRLAYNDY